MENQAANQAETNSTAKFKQKSLADAGNQMANQDETNSTAKSKEKSKQKSQTGMKETPRRDGSQG